MRVGLSRVLGCPVFNSPQIANCVNNHISGDKRYDAETDKVVNADVSEASKALDQVVDRFEQATQGKNFVEINKSFYISD